MNFEVTQEDIDAHTEAKPAIQLAIERYFCMYPRPNTGVTLYEEDAVVTNRYTAFWLTPLAPALNLREKPEEPFVVEIQQMQLWFPRKTYERPSGMRVLKHG